MELRWPSWHRSKIPLAKSWVSAYLRPRDNFIQAATNRLFVDVVQVVLELFPCDFCTELGQRLVDSLEITHVSELIFVHVAAKFAQEMLALHGLSLNKAGSIGTHVWLVSAVAFQIVAANCIVNLSRTR